MLAQEILYHRVKKRRDMGTGTNQGVTAGRRESLASG